jgi:sodium-dependent dicarboxylate transporter 2/3/5
MNMAGRRKREKQTEWRVWGAIVGVIVFGALFFLLPAQVDSKARITLALTGLAIIFWITETLPIGQTSFLILLVIGFTGIVPLDTALSGFSSGAIFLIIAGMMMAKAVNETLLIHRLTYYILMKIGSSTSRILAGIIMISQIQAFFIPATAVRTSLLLPAIIHLMRSFDYRAHPNIRRQFMLGVAFGGNISGTAILPAAIGNVLTVEILHMYLHINISYFQWFLLAFPIWLLLIPTVWYILVRSYPAEVKEIPGIREEMAQRAQELGPLTSAEKRCLLILIGTVVLWMTESLHHMPPAIPAVLAVFLLSMPCIGVASWKDTTDISLDTVFILGITLSLGKVLNDTGAIRYISSLLEHDWLTSGFHTPVLAVLFVVLLTQLYHLGVSNVSTAIVTLLPVLIGIAGKAGADPVMIAFTAALTCLFGFLLVIETMPNVLVQASGYVAQREFLIPGLWATLASILIMVLVAATWWKWIGFIS